MFLALSIVKTVWVFGGDSWVVPNLSVFIVLNLWLYMIYHHLVLLLAQYWHTFIHHTKYKTACRILSGDDTIFWPKLIYVEMNWVDFMKVDRWSKTGNWLVNPNYEIEKLAKNDDWIYSTKRFYHEIYMKNSQAWYVFYRSSTGSWIILLSWHVGCYSILVYYVMFQLALSYFCQMIFIWWGT